jgi:hypothetical protein
MADFTWRGLPEADWNATESWFSTNGLAPVFGDAAAFFPGAYVVEGGGSASTITLVDGAQPTLAGTGSEIYSATLLTLGSDTRLFVDNAVLLTGTTTLGQNAILDLTHAPAGSGLASIPGSASLGDLTLAPPPAGPGVINPSGGMLVIGDHTVEVNNLANGNSGVGNAFEARAGIIGSGTLLQAPFSDHPEVRVLQDGKPVSSLDFGTLHVGDAATLHFTLENFAGNSGGPPAQGAIQTLVHGGHVDDPALSGSGITAQNFTLAGRGGAEDFTVTLDTGQAHDLSGQDIHIAYQFNYGLFDIGEDLAITGSVVADAPSPVPIDWDALAARVEANFAATGKWFVPDDVSPVVDAPAPVDWDALAAQVEANFAATGQWFL